MTENVFTLKTFAWVGDGPVKVALIHVHEQTAPITLKMGASQKRMIELGPVEKSPEIPAL